LRYAVLLAGMSLRRHVNGLEFCYRTLVDRLGFAAENIQILNYDGSLRAFGDSDEVPCRLWPGDGTPFRMTVSAAGSRAAFQNALRAVCERLTQRDQVFINTTGHGGHHGNELGPDLLTHPHGRRYRRDDFCADLALLPPHRSLVVLMSQCFSGGFSQAVIDASPAEATCIATATSERRQSFMTLADGNWDSFQRNWIAGLAGHDVDGSPIELGTVRGKAGRVTVRQAFAYASTCPARNLYDSPEFAAGSCQAGETTLR